MGTNLTADRLRMVEAALALALAHMVVFWLPPRVLARVLTRDQPATVPNPETVAPESFARARAAALAVRRACRRLPWQNRCLARALALRLMLAWRGVACTIRFGVRKQDGGVRAHAWLSIGPHVLIGGEDADGFREIARFGERGPHAV